MNMDIAATQMVIDPKQTNAVCCATEAMAVRTLIFSTGEVTSPTSGRPGTAMITSNPGGEGSFVGAVLDDVDEGALVAVQVAGIMVVANPADGHKRAVHGMAVWATAQDNTCKLHFGKAPVDTAVYIGRLVYKTDNTVGVVP